MILQNYDKKTKKIKIGNGLDDKTELGPLTTKKRLNEIEELVETTKKKGQSFIWRQETQRI